MKSTDYRVKYSTFVSISKKYDKLRCRQIAVVFSDTGNRWTFVSESAGKNSVNAVIGGVGMLLSLCVL